MDWKDKLTVVLGVALIVVGALAFVWFLPISSEPIYDDYTHWGPHPSCVVCDENETTYLGYWGGDMCCTYHEDPYPLKGGHAYYNAFGIELYREWEWIS